MKEIDIAILNHIVYLRMQGLSDTQVKLLLEQEVLKGLVNVSKLTQNVKKD